MRSNTEMHDIVIVSNGVLGLSLGAEPTHRGVVDAAAVPRARRRGGRRAEGLDPEYTPPAELPTAMTTCLGHALRGYYASRQSFVCV